MHFKIKSMTLSKKDFKGFSCHKQLRPISPSRLRITLNMNDDLGVLTFKDAVCLYGEGIGPD